MYCTFRTLAIVLSTWSLHMRRFAPLLSLAIGDRSYRGAFDLRADTRKQAASSLNAAR